MSSSKERTIHDVDFSLEQSRKRIFEYKALGLMRNLEIERSVVDRLLDERLSFMRRRR